MSEQYTPTTEEVRWVYVRADRAALSRKEYEAEFDRWLAKHDAEVAAKASVKAWDEMAEYVAYVTDSAEGEYFKSQNPYRKEVD